MDPISKLRRMVGQSAAWQSLRGLTGDDAIAAVAEGYMEADQPRPHAIVAPTGIAGFRRFAGGSQDWMRPYGTLELLLSFDQPQGLTDAEAGRLEVYRHCMAILTDMANLSGAEDPGQPESHLPLSEIAIVGLTESPVEFRKSDGWYWNALILATYGDGV